MPVHSAGRRQGGDGPVLAARSVLRPALACMTDAPGEQTVLRAWGAGILAGESPLRTGQIDEQLRGIAAGLFMPVFFGLAGISTDLTVLADPRLLVLTVALIAIASIGKAAGAFTGGGLGGLRGRPTPAPAAGMKTPGPPPGL